MQSRSVVGVLVAVLFGAAVVGVIIRYPLAPQPGSPPAPPDAPVPIRPVGESVIVSVLPRDAIRPVYAPRFIPAQAARLEDEALVLGVVLDGAAKAYPVDILTFREMVNDRLRGIPILVTW